MMLFLGIKVPAQRCIGRAAVDLPADVGQGQTQVRGNRFLMGPIADILQIPEKAETTPPHRLFEQALAAKPLLR